MVAVERTQPLPAGRTPAFTPMGTVLAIAVIGIVVFLVGQVLVSEFPPVRAGSFSAVLGDVGPCSGIESDEGSSDCYVASFAEGREVGIGFTVRNDGPIGMTILAIEVIREGVSTPAVLEPRLIAEDEGFGLTEGVPFAPVDVPAGGELGIQFVGAFGDCETVAEQYVPGSGLSVSEAFMTVRWGIFTTEVQVPLTTALALSAPTSCP